MFTNIFCRVFLRSLMLLARVRRLYDIANVLASVGLIKKIRVLDENEASKAAFRWTGAVSPRFLEGNQKR